MELYTASSVEEEIYAAIRAVKPSLQTVALTPATRFYEIGLSSMDRLTSVFEMEERFGVSIADRQMDHFNTVAEARDTVLKLLASKQAEAGKGPEPGA